MNFFQKFLNFIKAKIAAWYYRSPFPKKGDLIHFDPQWIEKGSGRKGVKSILFLGVCDQYVHCIFCFAGRLEYNQCYRFEFTETLILYKIKPSDLQIIEF